MNPYQDFFYLKMYPFQDFFFLVKLPHQYQELLPNSQMFTRVGFVITIYSLNGVDIKIDTSSILISHKIALIELESI